MLKLLKRHSDTYIDDGHTRGGNISAPAPAPPPIPPEPEEVFIVKDLFNGAGYFADHVGEVGADWTPFLGTTPFPPAGDNFDKSVVGTDFIVNGPAVNLHGSDPWWYQSSGVIPSSDVVIEFDYSYRQYIMIGTSDRMDGNFFDDSQRNDTVVRFITFYRIEMRPYTGATVSNIPDPYPSDDYGTYHPAKIESGAAGVKLYVGGQLLFSNATPINNTGNFIAIRGYGSTNGIGCFMRNLRAYTPKP